jgi:hypothetical protein
LGLTVLGFGEQKTPEAFRNACHKFLFTEVLRPDTTNGTEPPAATTEDGTKEPSETTAKPSKTAGSQQKTFPRAFVLEALEKASDDSGWAHLGTFGSYLTKLQPDFDSRLYGFKKLSDLVKTKKDIFQSEERTVPGSDTKNIYVRAK